MHKQLELFDEEEYFPKVESKKLSGGSNNPIVFHDYESFISKFADKVKTTDDCYTPPDIYEAVVKWLSTKIDLKGKKILRPFYPGGDYENAYYPEDGIVIDNPPFSIFTKIVKFYTARKIPFFLFGPGLTIASCCKYCTAVIVSEGIKFENGAVVKCNFASNLFGDAIIYATPELSKMLKYCPSQNQKKELPIFCYPPELLSVSDMQTIAKGNHEFIVFRDEAEIIKKLGSNFNLFGDHLLVNSIKGAAKEAAKEAAKRATKIVLSEREKRIVARLKNRDST